MKRLVHARLDVEEKIIVTKKKLTEIEIAYKSAKPVKIGKYKVLISSLMVELCPTENQLITITGRIFFRQK